VKGGKKGGRGATEDGTVVADYRAEYAKSGAAKCRVCEEKIAKGEVRICRKDYDDDRAKQYGPLDRWHHLPCFVKQREALMFFMSAENLAGLNTLSKEDRALVKAELPKLKRKVEETAADEPDAKKMKTDPAEEREKEEMKKQNKKMFYYRDLLKKHCKKKELEALLEHNQQEVPAGEDRMLDRLCDLLTFGGLEPCAECGGGQLVYQSGAGYRCQGDLSEWTKCQVKALKPARREFKVPHEFKQNFDFLAMYKSKLGQRIIPSLPGVPSAPAANGATNGASG
jgi:poly [ADP-ribose] polymerase